MKQPFFAALGAALTCTTILASQAQPPQSGTGSDTPAIRQRLDVLRQTAGSEWIETVDFFCAVNPNRFTQCRTTPARYRRH